MKDSKYIVTLKSLLVILVASIMVTSCNDWIDLEPEDKIVLEEFWKTKSDVLSFVAGAYDSQRGSVVKTFYMGEIRADMIEGTKGDYLNISDHIILPSNYAVRWAEYYNTINLANTVMYYAPEVQKLDASLTDSLIGKIESEMLFLRSLNYFYLVKIWKEVPLVLNPTISDTVNFYIPKSTEPVILNQIISDLKKASGQASTDYTNKGVANKYAIQALLADIYLWKEDYANCNRYCDSIINTGLFGLESNATYFNLFYPGNSMVESIFEVQFVDDDTDLQISTFYSNGVFNTIRQNLAEYGFDEDLDIRRCGGKGPIWKYRGIDAVGSSDREDYEYDPNFIVYRYAEILLMKAEALAETGDLTNANNLLRQIVERSGFYYTETNDKGILMDNLLAERGREFGAEAKRWFDVLRFAKKNHFSDRQDLIDIVLGKGDDAQEIAILKSKVVDTMSYYLPIYINEIQYNKNLVQNPFYER